MYSLLRRRRRRLRIVALTFVCKFLERAAGYVMRTGRASDEHKQQFYTRNENTEKKLFISILSSTIVCTSQ